MTDTPDPLIDQLLAAGYFAARRLPDGSVVAVQMLLYTWSLCTGCDESGIATRYCYEHATDALIALHEWDGAGDPPGPWIKHKGGAVERLGPGAIDTAAHDSHASHGSHDSHGT